MKKKNKNQRRQFLKNTSLSLLSLGALPTLLSAAPVRTTKHSSLANCNPSTEDAYGQGPFYTQNAPTIQNSQLADTNEVGQRLIISGRVFNLDCSEIIPDTEIDVWHADDSGAYDNVGFKLRGKTTTNNQGFYIFETIKPGFYLNGASYRPSHIHFKITAPGTSTLTTQLYFENDPYIPGDAAASITNGSFDASARIIPLVPNSSGTFEGNWDIVIDGSGVPLHTPSIHLDKGVLYRADPNPFQNRLELEYGVFQEAFVSIAVYDINGQEVACLKKQKQSPEKYTMIWEPSSDLPKGHYFICLQVNDLQVHYLKVIRQ